MQTNYFWHLVWRHPTGLFVWPSTGLNVPLRSVFLLLSFCTQMPFYAVQSPLQTSWQVQAVQLFLPARSGDMSLNICLNGITNLFNPFPNKPWFLRASRTCLLKTLWEKEKLLVLSIFSSPTVFSTHLENFLPFSSNLKLSSAKSCSLGESKICHLVKGQVFTKQSQVLMTLVTSIFSYYHNILLLSEPH